MGLRELADLREDTAESCKDLARIELSFARGTPFPLTLPQVVSAHRLAFSRDGLAQAREALARATGAARAARLAALRDFLVRARALELEPGAAQEALEEPRRPSVRLVPALTTRRSCNTSVSLLLIWVSEAITGSIIPPSIRFIGCHTSAIRLFSITSLLPKFGEQSRFVWRTRPACRWITTITRPSSESS